MLVVAATDRELAFVEGVETLVCGIGPVEAAVATASALTARRPSAVLQIGLAGARGIEPPALVLGSAAVYADLIDPDSGVPRVDRVEPDAGLLARACLALPQANVLPIATSARLGGGTACDVEAMEGFGVLRAATLAGVPALELRAVSNAIGEADRGRWQIDTALAALARAVPVLIEALDEP